MAERAHVTSVDALESFRSSLVLYRSKARPTLEEVSAEVTRTRLWVENDQRRHWENEARRRSKALQEARQALFSATLTKLREATAAEIMAVNRAKRSMEEAETKLAVIKKWTREFDSQMGPLVKQLQSLEGTLANDLPQAIAYLTESIKTLAAYSETAPPSAAEGSRTNSENESLKGAEE
jgi:hypothetical protein